MGLIVMKLTVKKKKSFVIVLKMLKIQIKFDILG